MSKSLNRSIETWKKSDPTGMSSMSKGAIYYALVDAKHDILFLASVVERQSEIISKLRDSTSDA